MKVGAAVLSESLWKMNGPNGEKILIWSPKLFNILWIFPISCSNRIIFSWFSFSLGSLEFSLALWAPGAVWTLGLISLEEISSFSGWWFWGLGKVFKLMLIGRMETTNQREASAWKRALVVVRKHHVEHQQDFESLEVAQFSESAEKYLEIDFQFFSFHSIFDESHLLEALIKIGKTQLRCEFERNRSCGQTLFLLAVFSNTQPHPRQKWQNCELLYIFG